MSNICDGTCYELNYWRSKQKMDVSEEFIGIMEVIELLLQLNARRWSNNVRWNDLQFDKEYYYILLLALITRPPDGVLLAPALAARRGASPRYASYGVS